MHIDDDDDDDDDDDGNVDNDTGVDRQTQSNGSRISDSSGSRLTAPKTLAVQLMASEKKMNRRSGKFSDDFREVHSDRDDSSAVVESSVADVSAPTKVVRFDKTVDVLVEARKLKKAAQLEKKTKGLTPEEKASVIKPIAERLPQHIGTKITKDHKNYELMFDMLLGIRVSVSITCSQAVPSERVPMVAFEEIRDYAFPSEGSSTTPAHKMRDFKFRDYAPKVFRRLRHLFGVDSSDYLVSLTGVLLV
jgi:hypothetical protein